MTHQQTTPPPISHETAGAPVPAGATNGEGVALMAALAELGVRVTDALANAIDDSAVLSNETIQLLIHLDTHGPSRPSILADHVGTSRPQITKLLSRLEEQSLIRRDHGTEPDRRVVTVTLTPNGRRVIETADAILRDGFDDIARVLAAINGFLDRT